MENLEEHDSVEELLNEQQGDEFCSEEPAHKKPKKSEVKYTPKRCIRKLSGAHNLLIILEHALRTAPSSGKNKSSFLFPVDTATELLSLLEAADFAVEFLQANPAPSTAVPAAAPVPAPAAAPSEDPALKERIDKLNTEVQKLYTDKATIKKEAHFKIKEQEALIFQLQEKVSIADKEKKKLQEELLGLPTTGAFNALQREHSALQRENIALKSGFSEIEAVLRKVLPKPAVPKPASKPAAASAKPGGYEPENREPCARSVPKP